MNPERLPQIPSPPAQTLRHFRARFLPAIVIAACVICIAVLWRNNIAATSLVGQAEPVLANLSSHMPGRIAELNVTRFQRVRKGDLLGQVFVSDPQIVAASLAVVRAEIEEFQLDAVVGKQRAAVDYVQLRIDWMRQRAELASARANLRLAEIELDRNQRLLDDKLVSQSEFDIARATRDGLLGQVDELAKLVAEGEQSFKNINPTESLEKITGDPITAAINLKEARLREIEAELSPVQLRASIDGVITAVYFRSGESVTAGVPIISIASVQPIRIVGYIRSPEPGEPKIGSKVEVRSRLGKREVGIAQITEVGTQLEVPPLVLASSATPPNTELGLPIEVSLPANLAIRPGELVDLTLVTD